jgi:hypothetical protein
LTEKVAAPYGRYLNTQQDLFGGPMSKPSLSAIREQNPSKTSPWAESVKVV